MLTTQKRRDYSAVNTASTGPLPKLLSSLLLAGILGAQTESPWKRHTIDPDKPRLKSLRLTDINYDGLLDPVSSDPNSREVRIYTHPPHSRVRSITAWPRTIVSSICMAHDAVLVDLNRDGSLDLLAACPDPRPTALYVAWGPRWKPESIPAPNPIVHWSLAIPYHLINDPRPRILAAGRGDFAELNLYSPGANPRDLPQWTGKLLDSPGAIMGLITTDMDGDGDEDLLLSDAQGPTSGVFWLEAPGWQRHPIGASGEAAMALEEGDVDGDGLLDVVVAIHPGSLVWFRRLDATGLNWKRNSLPYPPQAGKVLAVTIGDLNRDGRNDIILGTEATPAGKEGIWWLEQAKNGFWKPHRLSGPEGVQFEHLELLDVDGDGDLDMIATEDRVPLGIIWYENPFQP